VDTLDKNGYVTLNKDECDSLDEVISFYEDQLTNIQPREDYKKIIELWIIILGGVPPRGTRFRLPGALHRARWMAGAIYAMKFGCLNHNFTCQIKKKGV